MGGAGVRGGGGPFDSSSPLGWAFLPGGVVAAGGGASGLRGGGGLVEPA